MAIYGMRCAVRELLLACDECREVSYLLLLSTIDEQDNGSLFSLSAGGHSAVI